MRKLLLAATAAAAIATPAAAAVTYDFTLFGSYAAAWSMPASPTPDVVGGVDAYFENVAFTLPGFVNANYRFVINTSTSGGGIDIVDPTNFSNSLLYRGLGDEIFTGNLGVPTFKTGTFTLYDFGNSPNGTLIISAQSTGAVPEPASWAMLIAGFGLTGAALRRRRTSVAAA